MNSRVFVIAFGLCAVSSLAQADLAVSIPDVTAPGAFDVTVTNSDASVVSAGADLNFAVVPQPGAVGTLSFSPASAPYAGGFGVNQLADSSWYATAFDFTGITIAPGTGTLLALDYTASPGASGTFKLQVIPGTLTDVLDNSATPTPFANTTFSNGSITIPTVPEPRAMLLLASGGAFLALAAGFRMRFQSCLGRKR